MNSRSRSTRVLTAGAGLLGLALAVGLLASPLGPWRGAQAAPLPDGKPITPPNAPDPTTDPKQRAAESQPYLPQHREARWQAGTPSEVLSALATDADFARLLDSITSGPERDPRAVGRTVTLGAPRFVRGVAPDSTDRFVVPLLVGRTTVAIAWVVVDPKSKIGYVGGMRGWDYQPSWPMFDEPAARQKASTPGDPVVSAELVWAYVRGLANDYQPFWRLVRTSGAEFYLFESGLLVSAKEVAIR